MGNPGVGDDEDIRRKEAIEKHLRRGASPPGQTAPKGAKGAVTLAAEDLGMTNNVTLHGWLRGVKGTIREPDWSLWSGAPKPIEPDEDETSPIERREVRDAAFWKKRANDFQKRLADAEHIAEQVAGLRNQSFHIPDWVLDKAPSKRGKSIIGLVVSDVHAGEVVKADELNHINSYDISICAKRFKRLIQTALEVPQRWISDCDNRGLILFLNGDLISGDIHEELRITNELTSSEQHRFMVEQLAAAIKLLEKAYHRVHVVSTPGNHGRTNYMARPSSKQFARMNYDTVTAQTVADLFAGSDNITFQIPPSIDAIVPVFGHSIFATHGHAMGSGGGQGRIGPMLPILRGTQKIDAQQSSVGRRHALTITSHFHTSGNPHESALSNGSIVGYSEHVNGFRASVEPPMQWCFLFHERWKLRERLPFKLEDPPAPEKPRVRVYV